MPTTWTDTFIGSPGDLLSAHTTDTGQPWVAYDLDPSATTGIILDGSNGIYAPAYHEVGLYLLDPPAPEPVKQKIQATLTFPVGSATHTTLNLYARHNRTVSPLSAFYIYGWCTAYHDAPSEVQCGITVVGVSGAHGNGNTHFPVTPGDPVVVTLDVISCDVANLYINGTLANTYTLPSDTEVPGGGYVGLLMERNALAGVDGSGHVSDFSAVFTEGTGPCVPPPPCDLTVTPTTSTVEAGSTEQFSVSGASAPVTWSVTEAGGGTITPTGLYTAPLVDGTYHVVATSIADPTCTATVTVTVVLACTDMPPQFWLFSDDRKIGRWQDDCRRDLQVGTNTATGEAIPDWTYSTGWDKTPAPTVLKGLLVDADDNITVTVAKTVAAVIPDEARQILVTPPADQDEAWHQAPSDLRAYKFRLQYSGKNGTTLRKAGYSRVKVDAVGG